MVVASGDVRLPRFRRREAGSEVDRLYRRHADEVFRYALLVMRSRPDAEDIVQTVFVRALRAVERGEKVRTPRNWLIKIAHNECRRTLSSRKTHVELPDEIAVEPIEGGRADELRVAMRALPDTQRQALVLRELEGRTYVEIATTLGLTVSAVETLIFRARRTLREQIEASMSCEDFVLLLDDPDARSRIRAHARVCADCATLERQARGRKSALKRIASMFGLPWWGAKLAAVGLTAATAVGVVAVAATPLHHYRHPRNPIPQGGTTVPVSKLVQVAHRPVVAPPTEQKVSDTKPRVSGTGAATPRADRRPAPTAPVIPLPQPKPAGPPAAAAVPTPAAAAAPPVRIPPAVTPPKGLPVTTPVATPAVPAVTTPVATTPALPAVTVPVVTPPPAPPVTIPVTVQTPTVPTVTAPLETPKVKLP